MEKVSALERQKITTISLTKAGIFVGMIGIAVLAPFLNFQPVVGTIVNASLFLGTYYLGISGGIMIGLIPSVVSISTGLLPLILAPAIPFIMLSNALLVTVFGSIKKNTALGVAAASVVKFAFLWSLTAILARFFLQTHTSLLVAKMFGVVQLLTALSGGLLALAIIQIQKKIKS